MKILGEILEGCHNTTVELTSRKTASARLLLREPLVVILSDCQSRNGFRNVQEMVSHLFGQWLQGWLTSWLLPCSVLLSSAMPCLCLALFCSSLFLLTGLPCSGLLLAAAGRHSPAPGHLDIVLPGQGVHSVHAVHSPAPGSTDYTARLCSTRCTQYKGKAETFGC